MIAALHAEWTKLRTVRGWVVGLVAGAAITVVGALLVTQGMVAPCGGNAGCAAPTGPDGATVTDSFFFVHQPLAGDGTITARITALTGQDDRGDEHLEPWAKAGLLVKDGTDQGAAYAAVMVTGGHGVRMQHDFVHDTAGPTGAATDESPRWLRLTRSGDVLTGFASTDGSSWEEVGTARLDDLPATVEIGLFAASPGATDFDQGPFRLSQSGAPTRATGVFDQVDLEGTDRGDWRGDHIGDDPVLAGLTSFEQVGDTFTVTGSGDIAPAAFGMDRSVEQSLVGTLVALIAVVVVGTVFVTAEYRKGMIGTTLAATPQRGRVLAAKALVLGGVTFVGGLVASTVAVWLVRQAADDKGVGLREVGLATEVRVVVGTAAVLALAGVLAVALGTLLRHSAAAVTAAIALIVLPYVVATGSVLPEGPAEWLLRLTPAGAFAVQQTLVEHHQVDNLYAPANGYYPLPPAAGFAVLCAYTAAALAWATVVLRRRDA